MGILSIFGKSKIDVNGVVIGAMKGLDQLRYTKEEKADDAYKYAELKFRTANALATHAENTANENSVRSKFRRDVGMLVIRMFSLITFGVIGAYFFGKAADVNFLLTLLGQWQYGFGAVITFLFTGYYAEKLQIVPKLKEIIKSKKDKKNV